MMDDETKLLLVFLKIIDRIKSLKISKFKVHMTSHIHTCTQNILFLSFTNILIAKHSTNLSMPITTATTMLKPSTALPESKKSTVSRYVYDQHL